MSKLWIFKVNRDWLWSIMGPWGCRREVARADVLEFLLNQCHQNDTPITSQIRFTNYNLLQGSPNGWNFHWVITVAAKFVPVTFGREIDLHIVDNILWKQCCFSLETTILSMASKSSLLSHNRCQLSAQWLRHPVWKQLRDPNPNWSADRQRLSEDRQRPDCVLRLCWPCYAASNNG